jgi:hypothetical protein
MAALPAKMSLSVIEFVDVMAWALEALKTEDYAYSIARLGAATKNELVPMTERWGTEKYGWKSEHLATDEHGFSRIRQGTCNSRSGTRL